MTKDDREKPPLPGLFVLLGIMSAAWVFYAWKQGHSPAGRRGTGWSFDGRPSGPAGAGSAGADLTASGSPAPYGMPSDAGAASGKTAASGREKQGRDPAAGGADLAMSVPGVAAGPGDPALTVPSGANGGRSATGGGAGGASALGAGGGLPGGLSGGAGGFGGVSGAPSRGPGAASSGETSTTALAPGREGAAAAKAASGSLSTFPKGMNKSDAAQYAAAMDAYKKATALTEQQAQAIRNDMKSANDRMQNLLNQASQTPTNGMGNPKEGEGGSGSLARGKDWPVNGGKVTQEFGATSFTLEPPMNYHGTYYPHFHSGIDVAAPMDTPIHAFDAGKVTYVGYDNSGYGEHVVISHPGGISTAYGHMDVGAHSPPVQVGQMVGAGDVIGYIGVTGNTTGPHTHFMVNNGGLVNPRTVLP